jgi:high-affinity K+ transport system ATPase subunit B
VTAELAIAIPALLLVVGVLLSATRWALDAITATSVTAESARALNEGGDEASVLGDARAAVPRGEWSVRRTQTETCVATVLPPPLPLLGHVTVEQCATR